jgi:hypothetical protein
MKKSTRPMGILGKNHDRTKRVFQAARQATMNAGRSPINAHNQSATTLVKVSPDGKRTTTKLKKGEGQATAPLAPFK